MEPESESASDHLPAVDQEHHSGTSNDDHADGSREARQNCGSLTCPELPAALNIQTSHYEHQSESRGADQGKQ
jgi:hypothetical protein